MDTTKTEEVCLECGEKIIGKNFNSFNHSFCYHLRKKHGIKLFEYKVKHERKGEHPKCACGCGNKVKFSKGVFLKYFSDHKNHMKLTKEQKMVYRSRLAKNRDVFDQIARCGVSQEKLIEAYDSFLQFKVSLMDIQKNLCLDKRTLKKYWKTLGLIPDMMVYERTAKRSQGMWKYKIVPPSSESLEKLDSLWPEIIEFLTNSKTKRTITEVIRIFDLKIGYNYLFDKIQEKYGVEFIKGYLRLCNQSKIEIEFFNILKFYFPYSIKKQFCLSGKTYDYILGNKILIELDGDYWHSKPQSQENDRIKDELAKDSGYILLRIGEKEVRNIEILVKIKEMYEEIQVNKS